MKKEFAMKYALLLNEGVLGLILLVLRIFNFFSTEQFWFIMCCLLVVLSVSVVGYFVREKNMMSVMKW